VNRLVSFVRELPIRVCIVVLSIFLTMGFLTRISHWNQVAASAFPEKHLIRATMNGDVRSLERAWVQADTRERGDALIGATMMGHGTVVKRLLELGADPNARTVSGRTALMLAAVKPEQLETARALLRAGAQVDTCDDNGWTAMKLAEQDGNVEMIRLLEDAQQESSDPEDRAHPSPQQSTR
jgi:ankyrin repeat protein